MNDIKRKFYEKFGELEFFLSVRVNCTKKFILLDQSVYIHNK